MFSVKASQVQNVFALPGAKLPSAALRKLPFAFPRRNMDRPSHQKKSKGRCNPGVPSALKNEGLVNLCLFLGHIY